MRQIERLGSFKRDYKRELKGMHRKTLEEELRPVIEGLAKDETLPGKYRNHALSGTWNNFFSVHIKPDLILIYRKIDNDTLHLIRLGSHAELGL
jgi:mRNA interferase YafQ